MDRMVKIVKYIILQMKGKGWSLPRISAAVIVPLCVSLYIMIGIINLMNPTSSGVGLSVIPLQDYSSNTNGEKYTILVATQKQESWVIPLNNDYKNIKLYVAMNDTDIINNRDMLSVSENRIHMSMPLIGISRPIAIVVNSKIEDVYARKTRYKAAELNFMLETKLTELLATLLPSLFAIGINIFSYKEP